MLLGRMLCQLVKQIRPKTRNSLAVYFWLFSILLILCVTNVLKKLYHDAGSDQFYAQTVLVIVASVLQLHLQLQK